MIVLGKMRLTSWNFRHLLRHNFNCHSVFRHVQCVFGSSKLNYYSTSRDHRQYNARRVASSNPFFYRFPSYMDKTAIIDKHGSWKYRDLLQASCKLADKLVEKYGQVEKQNGLNRARIGLFCDSDALLYIGLFAGWLVDAVIVHLYEDDKFTPENLHSGVKDTGCCVVLTTETRLPYLTAWTLFEGIQIELLEIKDFVNQADDETFTFSTAFPADEERFLTDLKFSENTDKDAIICHYIRKYLFQDEGRSIKNQRVWTFQNIISNIQCDKRSSWNDNDTVLFTPHILGDGLEITDVLVPLYFGATCLILPEYCPRLVLKELFTVEGSMAASNSHPVSKFSNVASVFANILDVVDKDITGEIKNSLRTVCMTRVEMVYLGIGQKLPKRWFHTLGCKILISLRTSYSGVYSTFMPSINELTSKYITYDSFIKPTLMGRIVVYHKAGFDTVYECIGDRILKSAPSVHGIEGELQLKGDCLPALFCNPDQVREPYTHDGWMKMGFIVSANWNGTIRFIPSHFNDWLVEDQIPISPSVIYKILRRHPAIRDLEVFRRPNPIPTQTIAVAVVLKNGASLTLKQIHEFLQLNAPFLRFKKYIYPSLLLRLKCMPKDQLEKRRQSLTMIILRKDLHENYDIEKMDLESDQNN